MLKKVIIYELYQQYALEATFDSNIKILVGENGIGKTTFMTIIYSVLTKNFFKLINYEFSHIYFEFYKGEKFTLYKSEIIDFFDENQTNRVQRIQERLGEKMISELMVALSQNRSIDEIMNTRNIIMLRRENRVSTSLLRRHIEDLDNHYNNLFSKNNTTVGAIEIIDKYINTDIIFLPTYRRIEEELINLRAEIPEEFDADENLIQFGMNDVSQIFHETTEHIRKLAVEAYSHVTGRLLNGMVRGFSNISETRKKKLLDYETIKLILDRIGDSINETTKKQILNKIEKGTILNNPTKNKPLMSFLLELITAYEKQKFYDNRIKEFVRCCNKYLVNKEVVYDEALLEIFIKNLRSDSKVELQNLSSGEKQIISLFTKIYLKIEGDFIIFFDEPELSLSINWQKLLLPDIINTDRCIFMLCTTHSPFVFDNDLDKNAAALKILES